LFTHEKIAVIVDHSWAVITAKSAHGVACTSLRRLGHPARALDWVPRIIFVLFLFFFGDHPLLSPHDGRDTQLLIQRFHRSNSIVLEQALQITTLPVFASNDRSSTSHSLSAMHQLTHRPIYTATPLSWEKKSIVMSRVDSSDMPLSHLICLNLMRHVSCICDTTHSSVT